MAENKTIKPDRYRVVPAPDHVGLQKLLNEGDKDGYKALFAIECKNGEEVVVMEHE